MTSQDLQTLTLLLENHFQKTNAQILQMRTDNAEFRAQMREDMDNFKKDFRNEFKEFKIEVNGKIDGMQTQINGIQTQINGLQTQIIGMQNDITGLSHDVQNLYMWQSWLMALILVVFVLPVFGENLKKIFAGLFDGVKFLRRVFSRK